MKTLRLMAALLVLAWPLEALAGTGTITVKDSTGATKTFDVVTDAGGHFVSTQVICDQAAAAQCASVTAGNALKVDNSGVTQPVSGAVTANAGSNLNTSALALEAGGNLAAVATNTTGAAKDASLATIDTDLKASQPRVVSGTVTANAGSGTFTTSDSHFPAAALLSDALGNPTTIQLGADLLAWDATNTVWRRVQVDPATGTVKVDPGTVTVTGSVSISNFPASQAVTGTFWQATQPVSGTFWQATQPVSAASLPLPTGAALEAGNLATLAGGVTGAKYQIRPLTSADVVSVTGASTPGDAVANPTSAALGESLLEGWDATNSVWRRAQVDAATGTLKVDGSGSTQPVSGTVALGAGAAAIGSVSVSNFPATQPVSGTVSATQGTSPWVTSDNHLPASAALSDALTNPTTSQVGANNLGWDATGSVWRRLQVTTGTGNLKVDGSGVTQPVSGTVSATQGTAAAASGGWPVKVTDGTNTGAVKAASTQPVAADPAQVVVLSPNYPSITPVVTATAANSKVLKASAGSFYSANATNQSTTAGFLVVINAISAPTSGSVITPLACAALPAMGSASINFGQIPQAYSTGITAMVTSATSCFTFTSGVITGFIGGQVQ